MNVEELKQKIVKREQSMRTFKLMETRYQALQKNIEDYGEKCVVLNVTFSSPAEILSFGLEGMPSITADVLAKAIGESIATLHRYIEGIENDLKGIVEFTD